MSNLFMDMHQQQAQSRTVSICGSSSVIDEKPAGDDDDDDEFANILSLKLKKPKHWKWELTASRSCTNIALPRILLYDHKGKLLVDTNNNQEEQTIRQEDVKLSRKRSKQKRISKAATTNLGSTIKQVLDNEFDDLCIAENIIDGTPSSKLSPVHSLTPNSIDFYTQDLPECKPKSQSSSFKEVRFRFDERNVPDNGMSTATASTSSFNITDLPTPPSTTTPASTSTSSGPQEKRRYRRSRSSGRSSGQSESILERFSLNKGRFSSPEFAEEQEIQQAPRYYFATSKAGTLVLQRESFSRYRRRRKPKHSSSENIQSNDSSPKQNNNLQFVNVAGKFQLQVPYSSLQNVSNSPPEPCQVTRKTLPIRRNRSDGIIRQRTQSSTTEEEDLNAKNTSAVQHQIYTKFKRQGKRDLVTIDPANGTLAPQEQPTAR